MKKIIKRAVAFIACLSVCVPGCIFAADNDSDEDQSPFISSNYNFYEAGDRQFRFGVGLTAPLFSWNADGAVITDTGLKLGGNGLLGYSWFLTPHFHLGGELTFTFLTTRADNQFYVIAGLFRTGWQFVWRRFELPLDFCAGVSMQNYNGSFYWGLVLRPSLGLYYRLNPEWSVGLGTVWNFLPQWYADRDDNRYMNMTEIDIGIHYHF